MLNEFTKFYYQALNSEKKKIYKELYEGFKNHQKTIKIHTDKTKISPRDVADIAVCVYNDTPSFYYLDVTKYSYIQTPFGYLYSQNYNYSKETIKSLDTKLSRGLAIFNQKYISDTMNEYQKEKVIHDYLVKTVTYDDKAIKADDYVDEAFNVLGPLLKKKAVCWGIACAFKLLCDYCKIKSFVVIGDTIPKENGDGHAWNMVKIDNETFHVDVTWDIKDKGDISFCYDYFNLDDKLMSFDHVWDSPLYPKCTSVKQNYYYKNHLYVKTPEQLSDYIAKKLSSKQNYIAVKFANKLPSEEVLEAAIQAGFQKAARYTKYQYLISERTHNIYIEIME